MSKDDDELPVVVEFGLRMEINHEMLKDFEGYDNRKKAAFIIMMLTDMLISDEYSIGHAVLQEPDGDKNCGDCDCHGSECGEKGPY